tara:strand:- start:215 stop:409 length:195 start_codon:yes stop_codon:yes gene_type:complete
MLDAKLKELINIQKERQLALQELSVVLGYDISFSDDEVMQFAMEEFEKHLMSRIEKGLGEALNG